MTKLLIGALAFIVCALVLVGSVHFKRVLGPSGLTMPVEVTVSKAYAGRGHHHRRGRRIARRATIRVIRHLTLPHSCVWHAPYHYCGGVYYQPIVESGTTVYIVVNP